MPAFFFSLLLGANQSACFSKRAIRFSEPLRYWRDPSVHPQLLIIIVLPLVHSSLKKAEIKKGIPLFSVRTSFSLRTFLQGKMIHQDQIMCLFSEFSNPSSQKLPAHSSSLSFEQKPSAIGTHLFWLGFRISAPSPNPFVSQTVDFALFGNFSTQWQFLSEPLTPLLASSSSRSQLHSSSETALHLLQFQRVKT